MNIIYITTAQETSDFDKFAELWKHPINPSNQVFHNKLIRALSITNHVDVISLRPFSKELTGVKKLLKVKKLTSQITWNYLKVINNKPLRYFSYLMNSLLIVRKCPKDSLIITDTINPSCVTLANNISKRYKMPIIGVCTDSPSNITGTTRKYTKSILKVAKDLSGYICLTTGLNDLFNEQNRPCLVIEGLVEDNRPDKIENKYGKYILMAGALSEKYGLYNLIEAFNKYNFNNRLNLVICGHHGDDGKIATSINGNDNIFYLGQLSNKEVMQLEASAYANINPRPFNEDLDRYSIPSKVLEYLNSGVPTISVKNTKLYKIFSEDIIWAKSNSPEDLIEAFDKLKTISAKEQKSLALKARDDVNHYFSLNAANTRLNGFLYLFRKK